MAAGRISRAATGAVLTLALLTAAGPFVGRHWAPLDLLAQFLLQAAVGTAALLLLLVWARRFRSAIAAGAVLALQLVTLAPLGGTAIGDAIAALRSPGAVRVVFFNVWRHNDRYPDVAAWLEQQRADVVILAEVGPSSADLLDRVAAWMPYRFDCLTRGGCDLAVFASRPVEMRFLQGRNGGTHLLEARVPFADGSLRILAGHLTRPIGVGTLARQLEQATRLAERVAAEPTETLVVGDLNAVPWAAVVEAIRAGTDLSAVPTLEGTWPAFLPWPLRIPIDNALHTPGVAVTAMRIGPFLGSDHRPIVLDIEPARSPRTSRTAGNGA